MRKLEGEKKTRQIQVSSRVVEHRLETVEQQRQEKLKLFQTIQQMNADGRV